MIFLIFTLFCLVPIHAQWYYVEGPTVPGGLDGLANYSFGEGAIPGSRYGHSLNTLSNQSIILFGGIGYTTTNSHGNLNDLWIFQDNIWTFVAGSMTINAVGVYSGNSTTIVYPGARGYFPLTRISNDSLILFGGYQGVSGDFYNDLWRYDPSLNQWYFMNGNSTLNDASSFLTSGGYPGARYFPTFTALSNDSLVLFGGYSTSNNLNELWRFDPLENEWYFMKGNESTSGLAFYSTTGNGIIGAKYGHSAVKISNESIFVFGGDGNNNLNAGYLNELWRYDPLTNSWFYINGSLNVNSIGNYSGTSQYPGSRSFHSFAVLSNDSMLIFAGEGITITTSQFGNLNDLWRYDPQTNNWLFIDGSTSLNIVVQYSILGD